MDEAAWYISRMVNAYRVRPSFIARLNTQGYSFEDITKALVVARRRVKVTVMTVLQITKTFSWSHIAATFDIPADDLDAAVALTFGGGETYGTGGVDH
jgi:hypothetical protein